MSVRSWKLDGRTANTSEVIYAEPTETFPNGLILTGSNDNLIRAFLEDESDPVFVLHGHTDAVCTLDSSTDGLIVSGSWDSTARLWNYDTCIGKLRRPGTTIWAVMFLPQSHPNEYLIATGSSDAVIAIWRIPSALLGQGFLTHESVTPTRLLRGHTDCVRSLALLDADRLLSASNDGSLRCWSLDSGTCTAEFYGHTSFVYSVAVDPTHHFIVSSGEDRTARVWPIPEVGVCSVQQLECQQTISLPCQTAWCVVVTVDGDIAVGCSDNRIRLFSRNPERQASDLALEVYNTELASFRVAEDTLGELDKHNLPGIEALTIPGRSEGQVMVIREESGVVCYQWSTGESRWVKVGDVVGSAEHSASGSNRILFEGKEYDYVFTVDFADNIPAVKLPFNRMDDPWVVAQAFLYKHNLPQDYLDTVAKYIIKQAGLDDSNISTGGGNACSDPFTGSGRYVPTGSTNQMSDTYFPAEKFITLEAINVKLVLPKLKEFNAIAPKGLSVKTLQLVENMNPEMSEEDVLSLTLSILELIELWPCELSFPLLDLLRCLVHWHSASDAIFQPAMWTSILRTSGLGHMKMDAAAVSTLSPAEVNCTLFLFRLMVNAIASDAGRVKAGSSIPASLPLVFEEARRLVKLFDSPASDIFAKKKNHLVALATLVHNLAVFACQNVSNHSTIITAIPMLRGLPGLCVRMATNLLLFTAPKGVEAVTHYPPEVTLRLLIALATSVITSAPGPTEGTSLSVEAEAALRMRRACLIGSAATAAEASETNVDVLVGWERIRDVLHFWAQCKIAQASIRRALDTRNLIGMVPSGVLLNSAPALNSPIMDYQLNVVRLQPIGCVDLTLLVILSVETHLTSAFCFLVQAKIGELTFPLATGPDILKAPFNLKHDDTFTTNDYDCQVMNQGAETFDAVVHCCYTGDDLKAALCVALVLPHWHCGSLFEKCTQEGASKRDVMLAVTCCLVIGITMLAVVCIIDFIHLCSDTRSGVERGVRLSLLYIGSLLTLTAVILYTVEISASWSYFIATCGSVFAVQLSLLGLLYGRCCNTYSAGVRINECH
ncbi:Phospholipase A-2-activating protein [Taenia crassiceps]|uniref:Phospholipase A-2-activating protein n=1 Tax=Taenia crassiceps TaxID=6207 RepID=A0ABR4QEZ9_9CEST